MSNSRQFRRKVDKYNGVKVRGKVPYKGTGEKADTPKPFNGQQPPPVRFMLSRIDEDGRPIKDDNPSASLPQKATGLNFGGLATGKTRTMAKQELDVDIE